MLLQAIPSQTLLFDLNTTASGQKEPPCTRDQITTIQSSSIALNMKQLLQPKSILSHQMKPTQIHPEPSNVQLADHLSVGGIIELRNGQLFDDVNNFRIIFVK